MKGWSNSCGWGFPKGKINDEESPMSCAIREVFEETGYDCTEKIDMHNVIERPGTATKRRTSLFIIPDIPENTIFAPRTRNEISVGLIDFFLHPIPADSLTLYFSSRKSIGL